MKLINEGITKEELDRAKNYLIGKNDISMQRNSSVNSRILLSYLYGLDINEPFNFMNQIENVDMNSINESIEEFGISFGVGVPVGRLFYKANG